MRLLRTVKTSGTKAMGAPVQGSGLERFNEFECSSKSHDGRNLC